MVLGGGNSGLEEGIFLAQFTDKVTVVEYKDKLAGSQVLQDKVEADPKMEVLLERKVAGFVPKDDGSGKVGTVILENVATGEREEHHPDGVFVFIGLDPNTDFLKGIVDLDAARVRRDRPDADDLAAGCVRGGRRARRLDQAARERGGRGRRGRDPDPRLPRAPAQRGRSPGRLAPGDEMDPKEIFELIIKADEKLKYSNEANMDAAQAAGDRPAHAGARRGQETPGTTRLVQQAETRLADLGGYAVAQPRKASSSVSRCAGESCSSESRPVIAIV